ncbi:hypothetical protein ACIP1U_30515 [Cupriavidus sp. NPDC089707]|uniref:hypothetical protein n=1 Tax=Cupriavidus sp. NPDC089707 TaxID=3363963 RepID=UPI00381463FF
MPRRALPPWLRRKLRQRIAPTGAVLLRPPGPVRVRSHITSSFTKPEVENRAQAIVLARKAGFDRADA